MASITTRAGKSSPLTHNEVDANFNNLNSDKLDTAGIALGSAASPTIKFTGDTNTGIYSPGADELAISTGGTGRLFVDASGNVGVGGAPTQKFVVFGNARVETTSTGNVGLEIYNGTRNTGVSSDFANSLTFVDHNQVLIFRDSQNAYAERLRITSAGRVGIGTSSPGTTLHVQGSATITSQANVTAKIGANTDSDVLIGSINGNTPFIASQGAYPLALFTNALERARIDSSGRLLVGTSSAAINLRDIQTTTDRSARLQLQAPLGPDASAAFIGWHSNGSGFYAPHLWLAKSNTANNTPGTNGLVSNGTDLGAVAFAGNDGTTFLNAATIVGQVDGTPGTNDMPGRLVFATAADGAASPTERLRITSAGVLQIADAGNITVGTTTGTKIGTATTQKLGFYNATPVVQPTAVADATDAASVITQLNALLTRMRNLGLIAT